MSVTDAFINHVLELVELTRQGDELSTKSLAALALLSEGWRPGDPDPSDNPPDDSGGTLIDLSEYRMKLAA